MGSPEAGVDDLFVQIPEIDGSQVVASGQQWDLRLTEGHARDVTELNIGLLLFEGEKHFVLSDIEHDDSAAL